MDAAISVCGYVWVVGYGWVWMGEREWVGGSGWERSGEWCEGVDSEELGERGWEVMNENDEERRTKTIRKIVNV